MAFEEEWRPEHAVVDEQPPRPSPPPGSSDDEYKWHTYNVYPSGRPDAVEFIDCYKSFGRAHILRGLNMGLPEGMVSMILGPSGTGKSVCIKHMVGLLYPDEDLHSAYVSIRTGSPTVRANAVEFLEHTLPVRVRQLLLPLIDTEVSLEDRVKVAVRVLGGGIETLS